MLDNIPLNERENKLYARLRIAIYVAFLLGVLFFAKLVLFPSVTFSVDPSKNRISQTSLIGSESKFSHDMTSEIASLMSVLLPLPTFDTFSQAEVRLYPKKTSTPPKNISIKARRGYEAVYLPEGRDISFPVGALIADEDQRYYIVSPQGFVELDQAFMRAYSLGIENFSFVKDLPGEPYGNFTYETTHTLPSGALLVNDENYFQLLDGVVIPFVSKQAFETEFLDKWALTISEETLKSYSIGDVPRGFRNGTLIQAEDAVWIISGDTRLPVANVFVYESYGYSWDAPLVVSSEEAALYRKAGFFTLGDIHPDGTLFQDSNEIIFIKKDVTLHEVDHPDLHELYQRQHPVAFDEGNLKTSLVPEGKFIDPIIGKSYYGATMDISLLESLAGNIYAVSLSSSESFELSTAEITLQREVSWDNFYYALSQIKRKIGDRF